MLLMRAVFENSAEGLKTRFSTMTDWKLLFFAAGALVFPLTAVGALAAGLAAGLAVGFLTEVGFLAAAFLLMEEG